eukprot:UN00694
MTMACLWLLLGVGQDGHNLLEKRGAGKIRQHRYEGHCWFYKAWFKYLIDNGAKKLMLINAKT